MSGRLWYSLAMAQNDHSSTGNRRDFDPVLQDQVETSLHGVYRFNAATAKYTVVWIWLMRVLAIGTGVAALVSLLGGVLLVITQTNIYLVPLDGHGSRHLVNMFAGDWMLYFGAAAALAIGHFFFSLMTRSMKLVHQVSMENAAQFNAGHEA